MTETVVVGRREGTAVLPDNSINWGDLGSSPYTTWSSWTSWKVTTGTQVQVQYLDDQGSIASRIPNLTVFDFEGDLSVELDISDTGTFTGEETNITFVVDAENTFVSGRYYRWTITVDANATYTVPILFDYNTFYTTDLSVESLEDVDVFASYTTTLSTNLGLVRNIQATALRGDPYVEEGYIQTAAQNISRFPISIDNLGPTGVTSTDPSDSRNFVSGSPVLDFDNSDSVSNMNALRISDTDSLEQIRGALTGTNDWTMEFNIYGVNANIGSQFIISQLDEEGALPSAVESFVLFTSISLSTEALAFRGGQPGSQYTLNYSATPGSSTFLSAGWNHIAIVKEGSTVSMYINGNREDTDTYSETDVQAAPIIIGGVDTDSDNIPDSYDTDSLMTGIRISDTARYSGTTYTVPTGLLYNDSNTTLLLQDSVTDQNGYEDNGIEYIIEQSGGSPVIKQKNPPQVEVVDYNGNAWDGTVDAVLRGYPKIVFNGFTVQAVNI